MPTPPYALEDALAWMHRTQREGPQSFVWRSQRKDGGIFWEQVTTSIVIFNGQTALLSSSIDISARRQAEERLRLLTRAIEQASVGVVITDCQGRIEYANNGMARMTGYSQDELMGLHTRIFQSGHTSKAEYAELWQTLLAGRVWRGEFHNLRKDGSLYWEFATLAPVRDAQGTITHFVGIKEDTTQRKQMVEDLAQAKEQAEAANRAKSAFLANMSHEIRTPMNGVMGIAELLLTSSLDAQQREWAQTIIHSAEQQLLVMNDILEFSRLESGKMPIERMRYDLVELLQEVLQPILIQVRQRPICCLLRQQAGLQQWHWGDPHRIRQILSNLLNNAVKFSQSGHVLLEVSYDHSNICFHVEDTGIGISSKDQEQLFQPFSQAEDSIARCYGGSGLGLAICYRLAEAMSGSIRLQSEEGRGSRFSLVLPLDIHPEQGPGRLLSQAPALDGRHFLLLSDYPLSGEIIAEQISREGGQSSLHVGDIAALNWDGCQALLLDASPEQALAWADALGDAGCGLPLCWLSRGHALADQEAAQRAKIDALLDLPTGLPLLSPFLLRLLQEDRPDFLTREHLIQKTESSTPADPNKPLAGIRLLLAEDNQVNQLVISAMLKNLGCDQIEVAENGRQALDAYLEQVPDLILMDIQMPEMNGLEATAAIRSRQQEAGRRPVPIIAVTANAMAGDRERYLAAGMDDYLSKPIKLKDLMAVISRSVQAHRKE